jgi:hypothetical protein
MGAAADLSPDFHENSSHSDKNCQMGADTEQRVTTDVRMSVAADLYQDFPKCRSRCTVSTANSQPLSGAPALNSTCTTWWLPLLRGLRAAIRVLVTAERAQQEYIDIKSALTSAMHLTFHAPPRRLRIFSRLNVQLVRVWSSVRGPSWSRFRAAQRKHQFCRASPRL